MTDQFIATERAKYDAARYARAKPVLDDLRALYRDGRITQQQFKTLRDQALNGDTNGAVKNMGKIMSIGG